jgi:hypothetical protein
MRGPAPPRAVDVSEPVFPEGYRSGAPWVTLPLEDRALWAQCLDGFFIPAPEKDLP